MNGTYMHFHCFASLQTQYICADYQGFASEHPEQLAKAIERGIPKSLRGMVWQLM